MDGQKSLYSCGFSPFRASFPLDIGDLIQWDFRPIGQNKYSLIIVNPFQTAGVGCIGASGLPLIRDEVGNGDLRSVCYDVLKVLLFPVQLLPHFLPNLHFCICQPSGFLDGILVAGESGEGENCAALSSMDICGLVLET